MGAQIHMGRDNFEGEGQAPICLTTDVNCAKAAELIEMSLGYGLDWAFGPEKACIRWGPDPHAKGQLLGERTCSGMPDNTLP